MDFLKQLNLVLNRELWIFFKRRETFKKKKNKKNKKTQNKTNILVLIKTSEKSQILKLGERNETFPSPSLPLFLLLLFNLFLGSRIEKFCSQLKMDHIWVWEGVSCLMIWVEDRRLLSDFESFDNQHRFLCVLICRMGKILACCL